MPNSLSPICSPEPIPRNPHPCTLTPQLQTLNVDPLFSHPSTQLFTPQYLTPIPQPGWIHVQSNKADALFLPLTEYFGGRCAAKLVAPDVGDDAVDPGTLTGAFLDDDDEGFSGEGVLEEEPASMEYRMGLRTDEGDDLMGGQPPAANDTWCWHPCPSALHLQPPPFEHHTFHACTSQHSAPFSIPSTPRPPSQTLASPPLSLTLQL